MSDGKTKAKPQTTIDIIKKALFWIFWSKDGVLVFLKYLLLMCALGILLVITYPTPSDYEQYKTAYTECMADGMVTESQCQSFAESIVE